MISPPNPGDHNIVKLVSWLQNTSLEVSFTTLVFCNVLWYTRSTITHDFCAFVFYHSAYHMPIAIVHVETNSLDRLDRLRSTILP